MEGEKFLHSHQKVYHEVLSGALLSGVSTAKTGDRQLTSKQMFSPSVSQSSHSTRRSTPRPWRGDRELVELLSLQPPCPSQRSL